MKYLLALFVLVSAGCTTQAAYTAAGVGIGAVISLDLCDEVQYNRKGSEVNLAAKCRAPLR